MKNKLPKVKIKTDHMGEFLPGKPGVIHITPWLSEKEHLTTLIHESLHAFAPFLDEPYVEDIATDLGRMLWREGYRKPDVFPKNAGNTIRAVK